MERTLLAGPWVGEFGWELFCWQGLVRNTSRSYDRTTVISRPGHEFLYSDFCDRFIGFDPGSWDTSMEYCGGATFDIEKFFAETGRYSHYLSGKFRMLFTAVNGNWSDQDNYFFNRQEFVLLKPTRSFPRFDLIFHPRNKAIGDFRSWHPNNWQELVDALCSNYSIAVIGNAAAFCPNNTSDFRGISLEELCNLIVQTKLVVGPSSGPMHFAALCGKKHLVWSAAHNRARYERVWNPFNTDVIFVDEFEWNPPRQRHRENHQG